MEAVRWVVERWRALLCLVCVGGLCSVRPGYGQVELIVRLQDEAGETIRAAMTSGAAKQGAMAALFAGVEAVRPVWGEARSQPFPAYVLSLPDSATFEAVRARWAARGEVAYVQPNRTYRLDALSAPARRTGDPLADSLEHLTVINAFEAWSLTAGHPGVRLGLIDTGLDFSHPDFAGQLWVNPGEDLDGDGRADPEEFNGRDDDGNGFVDDLHGFDFVDRPAEVERGDYQGRDADPSDDNVPGAGRGHGTTVAGVMAAARDNGVGIAGVAPGVRLVPLRAFGADGLGDDDDVAAALVYAADNGLDVVNLSFGDAVPSALMHEAIRYAVARGVVVVASAGNTGGDAPHYPSDYPEVISVAWLDATGTGIAARGTHGVGIDLGAPGSFVYTTLMPPAGAPDPMAVTARYGRRSGSSMAAPMVAGAAALLRALDPRLSPAAIRSILTTSARDIDAPGWDHRTAAGRLDVAGALLRALPARVEILHPVAEAGLGDAPVPVVGTAVDPSFREYTLSFAAGDEDPGDAWIPVATGRQPVWEDTLGVWEVSVLPEGRYTLRLAVHLASGKTVEERRRVFVDRSQPQLKVHLLEPALVRGTFGVLADVETDDLARVRMTVGKGGRVYPVEPERTGRRHGLVWEDKAETGGPVTVRLEAINAAGLSTVLDTTLDVPPRAPHTALFDEEVLSIPHGFLLRHATDFDGDGLHEIVFNQYEEGWLGDTLATYEWAGAGFRAVQKLVANVFPRDSGDTDGDGLEELLTQVGGATLLLEQSTPGAFPATTVFLDTTGLADPFDPEAAFGARLTDLDADGRGEILVHNTRQWRVLEFDGNGYQEVTRLENPTGVANTELDQNSFQEPEALVADFDGDGRTGLLVGDSDGDWILYEHEAGPAFRVAWTHETPRYNAGSRFARGDFDGDGRLEFVTFTQNWTQVRRDGEREPDAGLLFVWEAVGDDTYALRHRLALGGRPLSRHGTLAATDFDRDGRDELIVVHAPDLYVLSLEGPLPALRYYRGPEDGRGGGLRSTEVVTGDFDGDGYPELIAAGADERMHRFVFAAAQAATPPPRWRSAYALDATRVRLAWQAPDADSVTVYAGAPEGSLDPLVTTRDTLWVDATTVPRRYALRGWFAGRASPLSPARRVRPHAPARIIEVSYPGEATVRLVFSERLASGLRVDQFALDSGERPASLVTGHAGQAVVLRFDGVPPPDTLRWEGVRDAEGTPVGQEAVAIRFPAPAYGTLIVSGYDLPDPDRVVLHFSEPVDPAWATDVRNYRLRPEGRVVEAGHSPSAPERVTLRVEGRVLGATGLETALEVVRMRTPGGNTLAPEGHTVRLTRPAADLAGAYVFPNPYEEGVHAPRIVVAGLPAEATVQILSVQGGIVRVLEETDGDGGVAWDLRDTAGRLVPTGVYLVRIEAPGHRPVLRKAALIR